MTSLKIINQKDLKDWAKELFLEHNYKMIDVSDKQPLLEKHWLPEKLLLVKKPLN